LALAFCAGLVDFARSAPGAFTVTSRCTCVMASAPSTRLERDGRARVDALQA
jgi:hypothetical protein